MLNRLVFPIKTASSGQKLDLHLPGLELKIRDSCCCSLAIPRSQEAWQVVGKGEFQPPRVLLFSKLRQEVVLLGSEL